MRKTTINDNIKILWPSVPGTAALRGGWARGPGTADLQVKKISNKSKDKTKPPGR